MSFESFNARNKSEDLEDEVEYVEIKAFEYYQEQFEYSPEQTIETILKDGKGNISEVLSFVFNKDMLINSGDLDESLGGIIENSEVIHDNILSILEYRRDLPGYLKSNWNDFILDLRNLLDDDFGVSKIMEKSKGINYEDIPDKTEFKIAIKKGEYESTKTEGLRVVKLLQDIQKYSNDPQVKTLIKEMRMSA